MAGRVKGGRSGGVMGEVDGGIMAGYGKFVRSTYEKVTSWGKLSPALRDMIAIVGLRMWRWKRKRGRGVLKKEEIMVLEIREKGQPFGPPKGRERL